MISVRVRISVSRVKVRVRVRVDAFTVRRCRRFSVYRGIAADRYDVCR